MAVNYQVPDWAGKPPNGLYLDVIKDDSLLQKLMVDDKKCYFFGRKSELNDFVIEHSSCSRVHAVLVFHKHLNLSYLIDLGSTHGTFVNGTLRLEPFKPTVLYSDTRFNFGASTRHYVLRTAAKDISKDEIKASMQLANIDEQTQLNTAKNRKIHPVADQPRAKRHARVHFAEENVIINPEDVDPSIGRFRNLVKTTTIVTKRRWDQKQNDVLGIQSVDYQVEKAIKMNAHDNEMSFVLNPAPDLGDFDYAMSSNDSPKKKQYVKETWPKNCSFFE